MAAIDNDILYKGAGFRLLKEVLSAIPVKLNELGVLGSARFVVSKKLRKSQRIEELNLLEEVLMQLQCLEPSESEARFAAELEFEAQRSNLAVDCGESLLCAIVIERGFRWLVTGDKKAIKGLETLLTTRGDEKKLANKVVCLEQLLLRLIRNDDPAAVRRAICAQPTFDRALAICFSCVSQEIGPESWVEGLESHIRDVRSNAPSILSL